MNRTENDFSDLRDVVKNWTFSCSGDAPIGMENVVPVVSREISGAYEITTILFGFSNRNVAYHTQVFSADFSCSIPGGNIVEISVSSDDTATLTVGDLTASSTLGHSATAKTESWIQSPAGTLAVAGTYCNIGGPYSLAVSIVIKKSLRCLCFGFEYAPPNTENPGRTGTFPVSERRRIGLGEPVKIYVRDKIDDKAQTGLSVISISINGNDVFTEFYDGESEVVVGERKLVVPGDALISAIFDDGEVMQETLTIVAPSTQNDVADGEYYDDKIFSKTPISDSEIKQYWVAVSPQDVSFAFVGFWECTGTKTATGIFEKLSEEETTHVPNKPLMFLNEYHVWIDKAAFAFYRTIEGYEDLTKFDDGEVLGTLTWTIPVRWQVYATETAQALATAQDNDDREFSGEFVPASVQTMVCTKETDATGSILKISTTKKFS